MQVGSVTVGATHNASGGTTAAQQQALQHVIKPGLYATADVQAGSLLAAVPLALTVPLRPDKLKVGLLLGGSARGKGDVVVVG